MVAAPLENKRATVAERRMWGAMRMNPADLADVTGATYTYLLNGLPPAANWTFFSSRRRHTRSLWDWSSDVCSSDLGIRVAAFVDFVNGRTSPYDDNGHGTHVAGIVGGNGYDTLGARAGIAPAANLVSLKVLDDHGGGYISNVIAALDWVIANRVEYKIRVVNLSVGAAVTESYKTD